MPLPAPTSPNPKSTRASANAAKTCSARTARCAMSFSPPSLHSATTGLTLRSAMPSASHRRAIYSTIASWTRPTFSVFVSAIGVSSVPSSSICTSPAVLPKPLSTYDAAGSLFTNGLSAQGSTTVTPVLCVLVSTVQCPTVTPGTSLSLFSGPRSIVPTRRPKSAHCSCVGIKCHLQKQRRARQNRGCFPVSARIAPPAKGLFPSRGPSAVRSIILPC